MEKPPVVEFEPLLDLPQIKQVYLEDFQHRTDPIYTMLRLIACPPKDTIALARELTQNRDRLDREDIEFLETVLVYKLPNISREEIRAMLALNDIELKQTRFYQQFPI